MHVSKIPMGVFAHSIVNKNIQIVDQLGIVLREEERTIKVLDGKLKVGEYVAKYVCGVGPSDIRETEVKSITYTELLEGADHCDTSKDIVDLGVGDVGSYIAAVQVVDRQTDISIIGDVTETIEDKIVLLIGG